MGFEINRPTSKPIIKETQNAQDGGAGNLGYFEGEGGEKRGSKEDEQLFLKENDEFDTFKKEGDIEEVEEDISLSKMVAVAIFNVKEFFRNLFKGKD